VSESYTPRELINKINEGNNGPAFDPYGTEALRSRMRVKKINEGDIFAEAEEAIAQEKVIATDTPEAKIAAAEAQVEAMRQWLIQDGTYTPEEVDRKINGLSVEYDDQKDEAVVQNSLDLPSLTSAEGLTLPQSIGGNLDLDSLTSAEGLTLPQSIGGDLDLRSLTSAEGLTLPQSIGGSLRLYSLTSAEKQKLRQQRPDLADKIV